MKFKTYIISSICGVLVILSMVSALVYYVDPYFQYHEPRKEYAYNMDMNDFSYYNAGIAKSFSYDTIITGSSMSRSFLPSYIDQQFSCQSVKLSMAEARGKDFSILLSVVLKNKNLQRIIMGLDTFAFNVDKDYSSYEKPMYLYDDNPFNDGLYLVNMDGVLKTFHVLSNTVSGGSTTSMDAYQNYAMFNTFSANKVLEIYRQNSPVQQNEDFNQEELRETVLSNLEQNLLPSIEDNPEVQFLFYFPPYSIVKWGLMQNPSAEIACMKILIEQLIEYPNVSVFFYQGEQNTITDLEHYMDTIHFDSEIANRIVDFIANEDNKLTNENWEEVVNEFNSFIRDYDYTMLN